MNICFICDLVLWLQRLPWIILSPVTTYMKNYSQSNYTTKILERPQANDNYKQSGDAYFDLRPPKMDRYHRVPFTTYIWRFRLHDQIKKFTIYSAISNASHMLNNTSTLLKYELQTPLFAPARKGTTACLVWRQWKMAKGTNNDGQDAEGGHNVCSQQITESDVSAPYRFLFYEIACKDRIWTSRLLKNTTWRHCVLCRRCCFFIRYCESCKCNEL